MTQPAIQQRADVLRPAFQQCLGGVAYGGEQIGVAHQVGYLELKQAGLARAEHFTGPAQFQVFFGDDKSVVGFAHDAQALATNLRQRRVVQQDAMARSEEHTYELQSLMRNSYAVY